jgi:hypothetical protein
VTVPNKPVYRPSPLALAIGLSFWLVIVLLAWGVYLVVAG